MFIFAAEKLEAITMMTNSSSNGNDSGNSTSHSPEEANHKTKAHKQEGRRGVYTKHFLRAFQPLLSNWNE